MLEGREPLYQQNKATPFRRGKDLQQACLTEKSKREDTVQLRN